MAIQLERLESLLNEKATLEEIKKDLGVKNKISIQTAYGRLVALKGKVYEAPQGLFASPSKGNGRGIARTVLNGKQGLRLSRKRMAGLGFEGEERFEPVKVNEGVLLKKA